MQESQRRSLEELKFFPVIAWIVLLLFSYFVYTLVLELQSVTTELRESTERLERAVTADPNEISSFE